MHLNLIFSLQLIVRSLLDLDNFNVIVIFMLLFLFILVNPGVPLIARNVSEDSLVENEFLQLSCESFGGNPSPIIKWFRNSVQLQKVVVAPPAAKFGKASAIVVWLLSRADFGANFTCTAEIKDVPNSLVSNGTVLQVKCKPISLSDAINSFSVRFVF